MLYKLNTGDQLHSMLLTVSLFIEENSKLRQMLAQLASFIGDLGGGLLAARGIDMAEIKAASLRNDREWIFNKASEITEATKAEKEAAQMKDKGKGKSKANEPQRDPGADATSGEQLANAAWLSHDMTSAVAATSGSSAPVPSLRPTPNPQGISPNPSDGTEDAPSPDLFAQYLRASSLLPPTSLNSGGATTTPDLSSGSGITLNDQLGVAQFPGAISSWPTYQAVPPASSPLPGGNTLSSQASQLIN